LFQAVADGFGSTSGAKDKSPLMVRLKEGAYTVDEAYDVGIEAFENGAAGAVGPCDADYIDSSYCLCFV
jgi:hypothetical protein